MIGKRYKEEKKEHGNTRESINKQVKCHTDVSLDDKSTSQKIAEQTKVNPSTVKRAEKFADAVDKVAENTGINPQKILSGQISATRKDIQDVSKLEPEIQKRVFEKIEKKRRWKFW